MNYVVKHKTFEGPLDALLSLIEGHKMHVTDVQLAEITESFLSYIQGNELDIHQVSDFLHTASILLLIKARALLPHFTPTPQETVDIDTLKLRLECLEYVRSNSEKFLSLWQLVPLRTPFVPKNNEPRFIWDEQITKEGLAVLAHTIIQGMPKPEAKRPEVTIKKAILLEDVMSRMASRLRQELKYSFKEFTKVNAQHKVDVIVSFLALLELCKGGALDANQESVHGDIIISSKEVETPRYF